MEQKKRDPRKQAQLVVTVGSTSFPALSDAILSPSVFEILPELGIASVTVQAGSAEIPVHARGGEITYTTRRGSYVRVRTLRYTRDAVEMDALLKSADIVVSHAGEYTVTSGEGSTAEVSVAKADIRIGKHPYRAPNGEAAPRRAKRGADGQPPGRAGGCVGEGRLPRDMQAGVSPPSVSSQAARS